MKIDKVVFLSTGFVMLLAGAIWISAAQNRVAAANSGTSSANSERQLKSWERVDRAARRLKHTDEASVRVLVQEVFADNGISENIAATAGSIPDRLVAAEIAYQKSAADGVSEDKVVAAVNQLAQRFNAPPYAYTDIKELRRLRLKMIAVYPSLIGRGSAATRDDSRPHFERIMSPIEAFHVTATLVFQKVSNPEFQFSGKEIEDAVGAGSAATVADLNRSVAQGDRTQEILGIIRHGAASMSLRDLLNLSEQSLDRLGISR